MRVPNSWDSGEGQGSRELGGGAVTLGAWLALGTSLLVAVERTVTVMVVACPHALGLAVPLVVAMSTAGSRAARPPSPRP